MVFLGPYSSWEHGSAQSNLWKQVGHGFVKSHVAIQVVLVDGAGEGLSELRCLRSHDLEQRRRRRRFRAQKWILEVAALLQQIV